MADELTQAATIPDSGAGTQVAEAAVTSTTPVEIEVTKAADVAAEPVTEETKGKETSEQDGKAVVPEVYEFKAPEGTMLDEGAIALVTPVLKELGVTQEGAQKLAETFVQIQAAQIVSQKEAWLTELKADPALGGKNHEASKAQAQEAFAKFGTPELKKFLEDTGLGNHPELNRVFVNIQKHMAQDTHVPASASGGEQTTAQKLFPSMAKK